MTIYYKKSLLAASISFLVGMIFLSMMLFLYSLGKSAIETHSPQIDAIMEIKVETGKAHIWIEEVIFGDTTENIEEVWQHLDNAKWYTNALLNGGTDSNGYYYPPLSLNYQSKILRIYTNMHRFYALAKKRYANRQQSRAGSYDDQLFDVVYLELNQQLDELENSIIVVILKENQQFQFLGNLLFTLAFIASLLMAIVVYFLERGKQERLQLEQVSKKELERQRSNLEQEVLFQTKTISDANIKLKNAQKLAKVGNWERNLETGISYWSDEIYDIIARPYQDEATYEQAIEFIHPEDRKHVMQIVERALSESTDCDVEYRIIRPDGEVRHIHSYSVITEWTKNNKPLKLSGVLQDITERKKIEIDLAIEKTKAEEAAKTKSEFLANMSHEIRTPMNGVLGLTHLALQTQLTGKQKNYINKAHQSAKNLLGIINDILDYSKIEAGKLTMESVNFYLRDVIQNTLNMLQFKVEEKEIGLKVKINPDVPKDLTGDSLRLTQVLTNLMVNAVKFSDTGKNVTLHISLQEDNSSDAILLFSIEDSGIGISPELQSKLFQPFSQADDSTTRRYGGTGLGLVICKKIVEMMKGKIWVESQLGVGSIFSFTAQLGKQQGSHPLAAKTDDTEIKQLQQQLSGAKVLLVEDNEINQLVIEDLLASQGVKLITAENGQIALDILAREHFDGVLMDCMMPIMDGYEATRQIRAQEQFKDLPVIAMTASVMPSDKEKVLQAGMNDHIAKPIVPDVMFATMAKWIHSESATSDEAPPELETTMDEQLSQLYGVSKELSGISHKTKLYVRTLTTFRNSYKDFEQRFSSALLDEDYESMTREAHTIKGDAGTLGMPVLQQAALELEIACKESHDTIKDSLARLLVELNKVIDSLDVLD